MSAAITGAVIAGVSAVASFSAARKGRKAQERANESQRRINRLRNMQAQRGFLRGFRQQYADVITAGLAQGVGLGSSTLQGVRSSLISQRDTSLGEFEKMDDLGAEMTAQLGQASKYQGLSSMYSTIGSVASSFIAAGAPKQGSDPKPTHDFQGRPIQYD